MKKEKTDYTREQRRKKLDIRIKYTTDPKWLSYMLRRALAILRRHSFTDVEAEEFVTVCGFWGITPWKLEEDDAESSS